MRLTINQRKQIEDLEAQYQAIAAQARALYVDAVKGAIENGDDGELIDMGNFLAKFSVSVMDSRFPWEELARRREARAK